MADIRFEAKLWQTDGTVFSGVNEAGAAVRLRTSDTAGADGGEYTGNVAGTGVFTDRLTGLWSIEIDSGDSGWYLVQSYTTATGTWANVDGFAPIQILRDSMLPLGGGTMTGNIACGENDITGVGAITFTNDATGTIGGIKSENLLDKKASEEITGDWEATGEFNVSTADKLLSNSIIISPYITITRDIFTAGKTTADMNGTIFIADGGYEVVSIKTIHETAESTAGTCYFQIERLSGTEAETSGDDIMTNNGSAGLSFKTAAKTVQTGTIHATNKVLADGERLGFLMSANSTELAGVHVTVRLKRV